MKRLGLLVIALLLIGSILPVAAQSTPDLEALAVYYPQNTPLYVSFRTDDAFIDGLDAIRAHFDGALPGPAMADTTIREALNEFAPLASNGETFDSAVRPWLGDSAALGALSLDSLMGENDGPMLIAISITDRAQAQAFFEGLAPEGSLNVETTETYTLITPVQSIDPAAIYIDDQAMLLTNKPEALPVGGMPTPSLADNTQFQSSLAALPEPSYSVLGYVDYNALIQATFSQMADLRANSSASMGASMNQSMELLQPLLESFRGMGLGLTLLNDRSLTADFSLGWDSEAMSSLMADMTEFQPFDPAFAEHLPADTQLVMQGTNLAASVEQSLSNLETFATMEAQNNGTQGSAMNPLAGLDFAIRGVTGLDLQDGVLSWMTGQYAIGASLDFQTVLSSMSSDSLPPRALQFAFVVENTTGEGAQALVSGLSDGLNQLAAMSRDGNVTITQETAGGAPAILVSIASRGAREPFEILIGGNESVFVVGTPDMARAALSPDGGLNSDANYQEATSVAVANSPVFLYSSAHFLNTLVEQAALEVMAVSPVFNSASMSANYGESAFATRMVLTLSGE